MTFPLVDKVYELAVNAAQRSGCQVVDVALVNEGRGWILRVLVDKEPPPVTGPGEPATPAPGSGVTLEECGAVSSALAALLDVHDPIPHAYRLEVSSPGVNRPLKGPADFQRFSGRLAVIKCHQEVQGRKRFKGRLQGVEEHAVVLAAEPGGDPVRIPLEEIAKANLEFEFPVKSKPKSPPRGDGSSPGEAGGKKKRR